MKATGALLVIGSMAAGLTACGGRTEHAGGTTTPAEERPPGTRPASATPLEASIASVTLADDCASPALSAGFAAGCRHTSVQLALRVPAAYAAASLEVVEVRLMTLDHRPLQTLSPRGATVFQDGAYAPWDRALGEGDLNVSIQTSGPDWASIDGHQHGYGEEYRVEMDIRVGAETRTLEFSPASREPVLVT